MQMWVVYENPKDFPGKFVARLWVVLPNELKATPDFHVGESFDAVAAQLPPGLAFLYRSPGDDPCIVGTFL